MTALFQLGLADRSDVTLLPPYITHECSSGERRQFQPLTDDDSLRPLRQSILQKPIIVALFVLGAHYTTVIYNRHTNAFAYLNSIHTEAFSTPREVNIIQDLLRDEMKRQQLPIQSTAWTVEFPMVQMEPQQVYHSSIRTLCNFTPPSRATTVHATAVLRPSFQTVSCPLCQHPSDITNHRRLPLSQPPIQDHPFTTQHEHADRIHNQHPPRITSSQCPTIT